MIVSLVKNVSLHDVTTSAAPLLPSMRRLTTLQVLQLLRASAVPVAELMRTAPLPLSTTLVLLAMFTASV